MAPCACICFDSPRCCDFLGSVPALVPLGSGRRHVLLDICITTTSSGHHKRTAQRIVSTTQTQVHARSAHERTHASGSDVHWRGHHKFTTQRSVSTATLAQASNTHDVQAHCTCLHLCAPKRMQKKSPNFTQRTEGSRPMRKVWDFLESSLSLSLTLCLSLSL